MCGVGLRGGAGAGGGGGGTMEDIPLDRVCKSPDELHKWVRQHLGIDVPRKSLCAGHDAPFDYLCNAYFEPAQDCVVWAPRGGGKTRLGAAATLLDLLHKPGVSVRILGGSIEQSRKMWDHLIPDIERLLPEDDKGKPPFKRRASELKLDAYGSTAAVLTQSQKAVRGLRVQKMRCDEVELFWPEVWEAAQLVTKSATDRHGSPVRATIEAISTQHIPGGLMSRIIDNARATGQRVFRWCILDVLERCPPQRDCITCLLFPECQGRAKESGSGFVTIDDAIDMKRRVSDQVWKAEMLCHAPSLTGRVFAEFDPAVHVTDDLLPGLLSLGIDFGYANPFVCLWITWTDIGGGNRRFHVFDEYVQARRTVDQHILAMEARGWPRPEWVGCDPAGNHRNEQTAKSTIDLFKAQQYRVRNKASTIVEGIDLLRLLFRTDHGRPRLTISPRCKNLITALMAYRYPDVPDGENPLKDGVHDHLIDALRYWAINNERKDILPRSY